jgi:hypothetical protein
MSQRRHVHGALLSDGCNHPKGGKNHSEKLLVGVQFAKQGTDKRVGLTLPLNSTPHAALPKKPMSYEV